MGKYQGYENYKESGVEWLGEIPKYWEAKRLKQLTKLIDGDRGKNYPNESDLEDDGIPFLSTDNIKSNIFVFSQRTKFITVEKFESLSRGKLAKNDLVVTMRGTIGQTALFSNVPYETAFINAQMIIVRPTNVSAEFLKYISMSALWSKQLDFYSYGTAQQQLSGAILGILCLSLPPIHEQELIAHFLDRKTSQIDALIAKKEALLEKLDEKRTALISHAVTKGLDPNVPMKDSGVEWLGEIPAHWTVSKARFVSSIFVPQRNKPELNSDEGLPWLTMDDMSNERIKETLFKVSDVAFKIAGSKMLKKNSVIASCIGNFGICAINDVDVIINQQLQAFIPFSTIIPEYLCEIVRISNDYFKMIATAATVVYVNQTGFANMPILIPSKEEQEEIVNFIALKRTKIDQQKAKVKEAIALLKEYRTALITNAVTGKIDLRQEAA
jgi:type I restriction enzyme, S subunit